jgi:hypothetical protein
VLTHPAHTRFDLTHLLLGGIGVQKLLPVRHHAACHRACRVLAQNGAFKFKSNKAAPPHAIHVASEAN